MDREGSWRPAGIGRMTGFTRSWYAKRCVIWIYRLVVIGLMTTYAGIWGIVVISIWVTAVAIDRGMGSR